MNNYKISLDVLHVILPYVEPIILVRFFVIHNINFDTKFTYNMIQYGIDAVSATIICNMFPNMKLLGIHINNIINDLNDLNVRTNHLQHMKLSGMCIHNHFGKFVKLKLNEYFCSVDALMNFTNLKTLTIENANIYNIDSLLYCKSLQHLCIKCSGNEGRLDLYSLLECRKLKSIELHDLHVKSDANDSGETHEFNQIIEVITKCVNLRHIVLRHRKFANKHKKILANYKKKYSKKSHKITIIINGREI